MALNCNDPNAIIEAAKCFKCIPPGMHLAVQTYMLAVALGITTDPNELLRLAAVFKTIPPGMQLPVQNWLLCNLINA